MQVKVIKAINGLEEGDILNYNEKTHKYEIKKVEEDISDRGYSSKKTFHTYSANAILEAEDYFIHIDEEGNEFTVKDTLDEIKNIINNSKKEISKPTTQMELLEQRVKDLEQQLHDSKLLEDSRKTYHPFYDGYMYRIYNFQ